MGTGPTRRGSAGIVAVAATIGAHAAVALGQGYGVAIALSAIQALAVGVALWPGPGPARFPRWAAPAVTISLLAALALGARHSGATALLAASGVSHALLYAALLAGFAPTLRPGHEAVVTRFARALNPGFHPGMVPYTRKVTWAWSLFFAGQLLASAILLPTAPAAWAALVGILHAPMAAALLLAEIAVRRIRWRHQHVTTLRDTVQGVARMARAARTSRPGADCP